jgi:hypothetical protein
MVRVPRLPMSGYVVLPEIASSGYRGIDRRPFEPEVLDWEMASEPGPSGQVYTLYPTGWRRDAYQLYEDGRVPDTPPDVYLIERFETATEICRLISAHLEPHEVLHCRIGPGDKPGAKPDNATSSFLGFDVAYLGGDHYSAVLNGLLLNPHPLLVQRFGNLLNEAGLFSRTEVIDPYIHEFHRLVATESQSDFYVHTLSQPDRHHNA